MTDSPTDPDLRRRFLGLWRFSGSTRNGTTHPDRGSGSTGYILYHDSGTMMVQVMPGHDRGAFADPDHPTPAEAAAAFRGSIAYFGTWQVDAATGTVIHTRTGSINPSTIMPVVRRFAFDGADRVILNPVEHPENRIIWERVR